MTTLRAEGEVSAESIGKTAFPGVALARDAKPLSPGTAGKTVDQSWPDLAAGGRPAYTRPIQELQIETQNDVDGPSPVF
jgi:hypothetical protein